MYCFSSGLLHHVITATCLSDAIEMLFVQKQFASIGSCYEYVSYTIKDDELRLKRVQIGKVCEEVYQIKKEIVGGILNLILC